MFQLLLFDIFRSLPFTRLPCFVFFNMSSFIMYFVYQEFKLVSVLQVLMIQTFFTFNVHYFSHRLPKSVTFVCLLSNVGAMQFLVYSIDVILSQNYQFSVIGICPSHTHEWLNKLMNEWMNSHLHINRSTFSTVSYTFGKNLFTIYFSFQNTQKSRRPDTSLSLSHPYRLYFIFFSFYSFTLLFLFSFYCSL